MIKLYLSQHRWLRFTTFTILYFAQGMPIGILYIALPAWFAGQGLAPSQIASFIGVTGLPWGLKLFSGPLMDRFSFPPMGFRRPWVMGAQGGLFLSLIAMAMVPDPANNIFLLMVIGFVANTFAAVQDVAVDGMAIDILPVGERGRANAFMGAGQVMGSSISAAASSMLIRHGGFFSALFVAALVVGMISLFITIVRERPGERLLPWTIGTSAHNSIVVSESIIEIFRHLWKVLFLQMSVILTLAQFLVRFSEGIFSAIAPVVAVQQLGFSDAAYSQWVAAASAASAFFGVMMGPLIDRYGSERFARVAIIINVVVFLCIILLSKWWGRPVFLLNVLFVFSFSSQILFISVIALYMNICWSKVAATQFAIYMALSNLSRSIGAGAYALMVDLFSTSEIFLLMAVVFALSYAVFHFFNVNGNSSNH